MSLLVLDTPLTSRCGFVRGRKRIKPHPVSELQSQTYCERSSSDEEDGDKSSSMDAEASMLDDGCVQNWSNEQKTYRRYPLRGKTFR
ncbi:PREDICTED: uncharacterized protein LOC108614303 [Drosophila arizonae]|uniref:Uncharacterized protein LOC108614303 n=1 Tax=Drosophila arizonae TaxID=7263 RepID=A0ABM1P9H0_DROAR|nr:PREDICTED: uncharacterized protein LOC108614303 [Drosophila arizonae]